MSINYGKKFEERFKKDWVASTGGIIIRLFDNTSGYLSISNISDFICYKYPNIFFIECKSHKGASIPIEKITQYNKLITMSNILGVRSGVVLWLYEKDKVLYVPATTLQKLLLDGEKSVGVRHLETENIIEIPSKKLRVFMESDYSVLLSLQEGD